MSDDTTPPTAAAFTAADLAQLVAETFVDHVDHHEEIDSTNTRAKQLADANPADRSTLLVLADHQTAGRGRGANTWWSAPGALTFSLLLRDRAHNLPAHRWPQLSLAAGLAICDAIDEVASNSRTLELAASQLKWPNDVYLAGKKLAGILVESTTGPTACIILGIGINVNNSFAAAPPELQTRATSLQDAAGPTFSRTEVLLAVLKGLAASLKSLQSAACSLRPAYSRRCLLTGRTVEVALHDRNITGKCQGIDDDGALLVETASGTERLSSGTVTRFV